MSVWATQANEPVGLGDLVALNVLTYADAVGRIVAEADNGLIRCVLVRGGSSRQGSVIEVEEEQLLVRVYR